MKKLKITILTLLCGHFLLAQPYPPNTCPGSNGLSYGCQIGRTYYDLQSNAAVGNRIVLNDDGTISVVWTQSKTNVAQPIGSDRGIGYNHWDGTSWNSNVGECPTDNHGCASNYIGWPEIINNIGGAGDDELVFSHYNGSGNVGASVTTRASAGTGTWNATATMGIDTVFDVKAGALDLGGTWPRAVSVGDTIHMLYAWAASTAGDWVQDSSGMKDPIRYYRSTDGGQTWDIKNYDFSVDGLDTFKVSSIGGDASAIAARGNTVAITFGGWKDHWMLYKSTDGGVNWTETIIRDYSADTSLGFTGTHDIFDVNDDGHAVVIDNNGDVHAFSGRLFAGKAPGQADVFFPNGMLDVVTFPNGLWYWNESMSTPMIMGEAPYDLQGIPAAYNPSDTTWDITNELGAYFMGPVCMPTAAVAENGDIVCVFSAPVEGTSNTGDTSGQSFRDLYWTYSTDDGATWEGPYNIAEIQRNLPGGTPFEEDVFPSIVHTIGSDNLVYLTWQGDYEPGLHVRGDMDPQSENYIHFLAFDYLCLDPVVCDPIGINEILESQIALFPNPATDVLNINSDYDIEGISIMNAYGQMVRSEAVNNEKAAVINTSELSSGIYFVKVETTKGMITKKVSIQ